MDGIFSYMLKATNRQKQGELNREEIIDFLKLNHRWFSIKDLSEVFDISTNSIRNHCINLLNEGIIESTYFYKHQTENKRKKIEHYRYCRYS